MSKVRVECILAGHLTCVSKNSATYLTCGVAVFDFCELHIVTVTVVNFCELCDLCSQSFLMNSTIIHRFHDQS